MTLNYLGRAIVFSFAMLLWSCNTAGSTVNKSANPPGGAALSAGETGNIVHGCVESFDPQRDYFPEKVQLEYAKVFSVEYHKSFKVVTVHEASEGGSAEEYILVQCGAPMPEVAKGLAPASVISIPITSLFAGSMTHHPLLIDLGRVDVLTGVPKHNAATTKEIIERIQTGKVVEYGQDAVINVEKVIMESPSMIMASGSSSATYAAIRNAGVPVIANTEWLEDSALGRAEWVKFMALFLNEEAMAQRQFSMVRDHYNVLVDRTRDLARSERPKVMTGGVFRGMYSIAGGRSYVARLIADAGGNYLWSDNNDTGSAYIDIEMAVVRAATADFWLNGGNWPNLKMMLDDEPRYVEFKAYREGQVWLYNRKVNAAGSNDYWARGITRPDLILADMIKIFHPDLASDHEFEWYKQVPAS